MTPGRAGAAATTGNRGRRTLARELVLFAGFVALVAVLLSGVTAWYTARGNAEAQERDRLARQATVLSRVPRLSALLVEGEQQIAGANGVRLAVLDPSGALTGPAADAVSHAGRDRLLTHRPLSTTATLDGQEVLVEGRAGRAGGVVLTKATTEVDAAAARIRRNLVLPLCAGLLGAGAAGLLLARRIARPLTAAAGVAGRLAAGERGTTATAPDEDPRAAAGPREVAEVSRALAVLDRELARSEERRREFLLSVSHEIRTPLTTIRGYAEALADGVVPADRVPATGRLLGAESERLDRFLRDLLDLARLEADAADFRIDTTDTDLTALVTHAAGTWRERCARHGVRFALERPESGPPLTLRTDGFRVRQLADCLLENALRLTPEGGPVVLAVAPAPEGGGALLQVRDGGPGLTDEDVEVAFERGALHDRYRGERPVGSGLGLAIAHRLATRLGGTLTVLGHGPEGGAAFTLTLPADPP
ncbi:sensor histidine kinase KdpD [Streptomyces sp. WAC06614]|uniref:sensor histidine kinase n=1 Tax=Streptomyces sp. WAC06614 TaxID=2487416 RepID=UPI000F7B8148|nr:HAMP domain-containing sensor histidine kinase [Streptomyces sp. WAC06614]RSS81940.1 sensor histidine kinase [Streptomyces sp. WAC06614]